MEQNESIGALWLRVNCVHRCELMWLVDRMDLRSADALWLTGCSVGWVGQSKWNWWICIEWIEAASRRRLRWAAGRMSWCVVCAGRIWSTDQTKRIVCGSSGGCQRRGRYTWAGRQWATAHRHMTLIWRWWYQFTIQLLRLLRIRLH